MMTRPSTRRRPAGFTLTEVMIALAMTALLLIGISKIFAITSSTISAGQAMAKAMRSQRAIQQVLSNDFLGSGGADLGGATYSSGMLPLVNTVDPEYAAPLLTISSFRVPTYRNATEMAADSIGPIAPAGSSVTVSEYASRSLAIRGIDLNNDGVENTTPTVTAGGETIPLYFYGDRNFRCDTLSFVTHGRFQTQNGSKGQLQDPVTSNEAWIWYGHLRTFNSDITRLNLSNGQGPPGDWLTPTGSGLANRNNRFADQFRLGRFQFLLVEPTDQNGIPSSTSPDGNLQDYNTVTVGGDPTRPVYFVQRNWWNTRYLNGTVRPSAFDLTWTINVFEPTAAANGKNQSLNLDDKTTIGGSTSSTTLKAQTGRTDVLGIGVRTLQKRVAFMEQNDIDVAPTPGQSAWWQTLPTSWVDRFFVNPFPALPMTPIGIAQRNLTISDSVSQFIVEYAGDFLTQNPDGTLDTTYGNRPDGVLDFSVVNNVRQTRWYGMPRDVDQSGTIVAGATSPDVVPLRDYRGVASNFEKAYPVQVADYAAVVTEQSGMRGNNKPVDGSPNDTAYICTWGPREFNSTYTTPAGTILPDSVPQLIRVLTDIRDPDGKVKEALTQEYVFPVRVTGAVKPPSTTP